MKLKDIHALAVLLRDQKQYLQIVYVIPKGARYPRGPRGGERGGRVVEKSTRTGTGPLDVSNLSNTELLDLLMRYADPERGPKARRIVILSATPARKR